MQTLLLFAELVIAIALVVVVLLQKSEGGALGIGGGGGGGGMGGLFTPRGAGDALTRTTAILAVLFFATCIALSLLALHGRDQTSLLDRVPAKTAPVSAPKPAAPVTPAIPGPSVPKPQ